MTKPVQYELTLKDFLTSKLKEAEEGAVKLEATMSTLGKTVAGFFVADKIMDFGNQVVQTLSEFERYDAVLTNTLGSGSAAMSAMDMIKDFAKTTPFQVNELTGAFVKLANQGLVPNQQQMVSLGDLASSTGKSFGQLSEAILDAQVGEFERLKEFGIRASKEGDRVKFTFKGVTQEVGFTEKAIQDYILSLGTAQGVSGAMAAISQTTGGQISNLEDSVTDLYLTIGESLKPAISAVLTGLQGFIGVLKDTWNWLVQNKNLVIALAAGVAVGAVAWGTYQLVVNAATIATNIMTAATWALDAAMSANPIGLMITAFAAVTAAVIYAYREFGTFRAILWGVWGTIKAWVKIVTDAFMGYWKMIKGIFTLDANMVTEGFKQSADAMVNAGRRLVDGFKKGYEEGMADFNKDQQKKTVSAPGMTKTGQAPGSATGKGKAASAAITPKSETKGAQGSKAVTITVNIGSLIKDFKISTTNMQEGAAKVREMVAQAMVNATNDSQLIAGQ